MADALPRPAAHHTGFNWRRFGAGVVVIASLVGFGWAFTLNETPEPERGFPKAVEVLSPVPGADAVPSQSPISADLVFGYTGVLLINGVEIPLDQIDRNPAQAIISFTPGEGKEMRRLPAGRLCAGVVFWPTTGSQEVDGQSYDRWCFTVN